MEEVALGDYVGAIGIIDSHTCCIWTVADSNMGHVDAFTQIEVESNLELADTRVDKVLARAVVKRCTLEERDIIECDISHIDKGN